MKIFLRNWIYVFLGKLSDVFHIKKPKILIFAYHSLGESDWLYEISYQIFKDQIYELKKTRKYIKLEEIYKYLMGEIDLDGEYFCVCFDDGYKNIFDYADNITNDLKITPSVFLISDRTKINHHELENYKELLSEDDIKYLIYLGWEIGSHTSTHPNLKNSSVCEKEAEITNSKKQLEKQLNISIKYIAYPKGCYDKDVISISKKAGYLLGLTMDDDIIDKSCDLLKIPRIGVDKSHGKKIFQYIYLPLNIYFRALVKHIS